jgi:hypothetical protein
MRDAETGVCSECASPPEAYHARMCSLFKGYEMTEQTAQGVLAAHQANEKYGLHDGWVECWCSGKQAFSPQHQLDSLRAARYAVVELPERLDQVVAEAIWRATVPAAAAKGLTLGEMAEHTQGVFRSMASAAIQALGLTEVTDGEQNPGDMP